jgi:hypothetical protein
MQFTLTKCLIKTRMKLTKGKIMTNSYRSLMILVVMVLFCAGFSPVSVHALPSESSLILGSETDVVLERTATYVDSGITATFEGTVTKLTVSITNGHSGDLLDAPNFPACDYNESTTTLMCTGTFTSPQVTEILRDVMFDSLSSITTARTIEFWVGTSIIPFEVEPGVFHYYEYVDDGLSWTSAKIAAESRTFEGMSGYLASVSSAAENEFISTKLGNNAWLGGSDDYQQINAALGSTVYANQSEAEGHWYWVSGPDAGTRISDNNGTPTPVDGAYTAWASGEPNNAGGEHYLEIYVSSQNWNDLPNGPYGFGYVVEYSGGTDVNLISLNATKILVFEPTIVRYAVDDDEVTGTVPVDLDSYIAGDTVTVLGNPGNLTKTNSVFVGWSDGETVYAEGETFEFTGRTVLLAVFVVLNATDGPLYYISGSGDRSIDDDLDYEGAWASLFKVTLTDFKTGDYLHFDRADGTYRYNIDGYVYYTMTSTFDEATATLTVMTSIPIPYWQIENYLSNHTYFGTDGELGDRTMTIRVYRTADAVLIQDQRTISVFDGYSITYVTGDGYTVDADTSIYDHGSWFWAYTPRDLDSEHPHFLYWVDQNGRSYFPDWGYAITSDLTLSPVFTPTVKDSTGNTDILPQLPHVGGMVTFIDENYADYNDYEAWKVFIRVYGIDPSDLDPEVWDQFTEYFDATYLEDDHTYFLMDVSLWIAYWYSVGEMPNYDSFGELEDSDEQPYPVTVTLTLPEALRGKSDYAMVRIHNGTITVLPVVVDETTWTVSFETDRFSFYALTYAEPLDIPDTGDAAGLGNVFLLAGAMLLMLSRRKKLN